MSNGVRVPARGWWEKEKATEQVRELCRSRGIDPNVVGEPTIGRHSGKPVFNVPLDLADQDVMLVKLALL